MGSVTTLSHRRPRAGLGLSSVIPVAEGEFHSALPGDKLSILNMASLWPTRTPVAVPTFSLNS